MIKLYEMLFLELVFTKHIEGTDLEFCELKWKSMVNRSMNTNFGACKALRQCSIFCFKFIFFSLKHVREQPDPSQTDLGTHWPGFIDKNAEAL